jgi:two-component system chemotaxis response regulator CheY
MRILIVDDSKAMRGIVMRSLRQAGYGDHTFEEAANGALALVAVKTAPPDFVLCDLNMPEMSGMEFLRAIREDNVGVRVGFITSDSTNDVMEQALAAGASFLITKPFTPTALKDAMGRALQ